MKSSLSLLAISPARRGTFPRASPFDYMTLPVFGLGMGEMIGWHAQPWIQLTLATPVVLWAGAPFFVPSPQFPADQFAFTIGPKNVEVENVRRVIDALPRRGQRDELGLPEQVGLGLRQLVVLVRAPVVDERRAGLEPQGEAGVRFHRPRA